MRACLLFLDESPSWKHFSDSLTLTILTEASEKLQEYLCEVVVQSGHDGGQARTRRQQSGCDDEAGILMAVDPPGRHRAVALNCGVSIPCATKNFILVVGSS